jgi:hypothetical protein
LDVCGDAESSIPQAAARSASFTVPSAIWVSSLSASFCEAAVRVPAYQRCLDGEVPARGTKRTTLALANQTTSACPGKLEDGFPKKGHAPTREQREQTTMGRYLLLFLLGVPLPILVLIWLLGGLH